jgi:hypothetical protein
VRQTGNSSAASAIKAILNAALPAKAGTNSAAAGRWPVLPGGGDRD